MLYSEGGASWYPDGTDFLRRDPPSLRTAPFEYGWDSPAKIEAAVAAAVARLTTSRPFDDFEIGADGVD